MKEKVLDLHDLTAFPAFGKSGGGERGEVGGKAGGGVAKCGCVVVLAQKCVWFLPVHIFLHFCICCISHISWHLNAL